MGKAVFAWIAAFAITAILARGAAWQMAFQMTVPFPSYDEDAVYQRIKDRVFTRAWLICAIASSTSVAGAMLVDEVPMLLLMGFGIVLITTQTLVQAYRLFRAALREMGLPWPPAASI